MQAGGPLWGCYPPAGGPAQESRLPAGNEPASREVRRRPGSPDAPATDARTARYLRTPACCYTGRAATSAARGPVVELADTRDLKSLAPGRVGSSPTGAIGANLWCGRRAGSRRCGRPVPAPARRCGPAPATGRGAGCCPPGCARRRACPRAGGGASPGRPAPGPPRPAGGGGAGCTALAKRASTAASRASLLASCPTAPAGRTATTRAALATSIPTQIISDAMTVPSSCGPAMVRARGHGEVPTCATAWPHRPEGPG